MAFFDLLPMEGMVYPLIKMAGFYPLFLAGFLAADSTDYSEIFFKYTLA